VGKTKEIKTGSDVKRFFSNHPKKVFVNFFFVAGGIFFLHLCNNFPTLVKGGLWGGALLLVHLLFGWWGGFFSLIS